MANILITGTSKGIGLTTALAFARKGHTVAATMRNPEAAPALSDAAEKEKLDIKIYRMDVDADVSVKECIKKVVNEIGPVDVLVNNAGIERMGTVEDLTMDDFRAVMETNYFGVIRCIKAVLPDMRKRGSGCIINIASIAGQIASAAMSAYSASKFALESLSEILAQEVKALGIKVAIVEPGIIDTSMAQHITVKPAESLYSHAERLSALFTSSLKRPVSPEIVADKITEIAESENPALRHLVGPDAIPFLGWRRSMTDEQWVALAGLDDNTWYEKMEGDFGMELRIYASPQ